MVRNAKLFIRQSNLTFRIIDPEDMSSADKEEIRLEAILLCRQPAVMIRVQVLEWNGSEARLQILEEET